MKITRAEDITISLSRDEVIEMLHKFCGIDAPNHELDITEIEPWPSAAGVVLRVVLRHWPRPENKALLDPDEDQETDVCPSCGDIYVIEKGHGCAGYVDPGK